MGDEDIDAGWDEVSPARPTATEGAAASVSPPRSSLATPLPTIASLRPVEVEPPPATAARPRLAWLLMPVAAALALAVGGAAWLNRPVAAPAQGARPLAPVPVVPAPAPAPSPAPEPATVPAQPVDDARLMLEPLVIEPPVTASVKVRSVPPGAIFFEAGKRLGIGEVTLDVAPRATRRLTALLDGHAPLNFKVDGERDSLTVKLTPVVPAAEPAPATASTN